jgi:hypothetical protein
MNLLRQLAAPVFSAVFATVLFLGTGLHLLPGCGHFHGAFHYCSGHHHIATFYANRGHAEFANSEAGHSHDDCAICRFLAIPRVLTPPPTIVTVGVRFEPTVDATFIPPSLDIERPYGARAPPRPSLNA